MHSDPQLTFAGLLKPWSKKCYAHVWLRIGVLYHTNPSSKASKRWEFLNAVDGLEGSKCISLFCCFAFFLGHRVHSRPCAQGSCQADKTWVSYMLVKQDLNSCTICETLRNTSCMNGAEFGRSDHQTRYTLWTLDIDIFLANALLAIFSQV